MTTAYPPAFRADLQEILNGYLVADPYRWLEDPGSKETRSWLAAQDALYAEHLAALPGRESLATRLAELLGAGTVSTPSWRGGRRFLLRRMPGQEHAVLYTAAASGGERALIDPMQIDPSGSTTLDAWQPDKEGRLLAYQLSEAGAEESTLRVMDAETGQDVDGPIDRCRYSGVAWLPGGKAFYYTRRLAPDAVPDGEDQYHRRVYLHRVGTPADDDTMIFGEGREKTNYYMASVSLDGRWLIIGAAAGTAPRNDLWLADLTASGEAAPDLRVLQQDVDAQTTARAGRDGVLYIFTDRDAPRGRLLAADPAEPGFSGWREKIPQDPEAVLTGYAILDGDELGRPVLLASWTRHAIGEISVHDLATGERLGSIPLPGLGTVAGLSERPEGGHEAWFAYTDNTTPVAIYRYDARTSRVGLWEWAPGAVNVPDVDTRQVAYQSADGTTVRMLVIAGRQDRREPRPAILTGYGGFGISMLPGYAPTALAWAEAGGVYAIAGLRGGSEEGEDWHRAGMRDRKRCVFDDFHAAAGKLIADGWTTPAQLAISGGSNGGLLVGAALTQRPELYAAVVCSAPLLDMVRYERFGLGETWNDEYGTAADPVQLGWLLSYSPYHHVREGTRYPAVLFTVFESDTRVDPLHARKMCAALQHAAPDSLARRPVLLRRESDVGHGARAVSRSVSLGAETLAFAAFHTGLGL
ncbi:MAG TPA: prolyl oligopeptidase family serine peptidase [Streptosporangiaceae bacterium]|nr:prolyl oligopeptidase family serine peptidase [Streptosporangiaceae bacterium]